MAEPSTWHGDTRLAIGLTGGIGSGKTRVADLLQGWGAAQVDTDRIAHALTAPGGAAMPALAERFGPGIVAPDGALDRAAMREAAFADPQARRALEAILHPLIAQETLRQARQAQGLYLVFVVPLLVESGRWRERVDRICVVDCDPQTQVERVRRRSGLTTETIRRIMAAQAGRQERLAVADDVIVNDGHTHAAQLELRVRALHERYCQLAATSRRTAM
ncbi:dephospho-CoA kinase [Orrella sp. JC864]|uniref:dephospho-CoA kinase n=1 Tax=Orrella sp. JC864 TaxID=3120298 RepID=UPI0012BB6A16